MLYLSLFAHAATMMEEYYLPLPEDQWRTSFNTISPGTSMTMESISTLVIWGDGAILHYDHWEDSYELEIARPVQQSTEIWGDGNDGNGKPPGYASDPVGFSKGAVIVLWNQVSLPRDVSILYDGRDRIASTRPLSVSRAGWATIPGSRVAGAVNVSAIRDYGLRFVCPLGENVTTASGLFTYTGLLVMAQESATEVQIDLDGAGAGEAIEIVLNRGESYLADGGILLGATVEASQPVQAHLITGKRDCYCYMTRSYTLYPEDQWTDGYTCPISTTGKSYVFVYNPNAHPLTIHTTSIAGTGSFQVDALSVSSWEMPIRSGARFQSDGNDPFQALIAVNAQLYAAHMWEWGASLVPDAALTAEAIIGWAPGSYDLTENDNPVLVAPTAATRVYADFNGDGQGPLVDPKGGRYDAGYDLNAYQCQMIYEPDNDQTGMRLYTMNNVLFAAAWGNHSEGFRKDTTYPYELEIGYIILPASQLSLQKECVTKEDLGMPGVSVGDILEYRVTVFNNGLRNLEAIGVRDVPHPSLIYQANSTRINGNSIGDDAAGTTLFPLDESGYLIPSLDRNKTAVFSYMVKVGASGTLDNTVSVPDYGLESEYVLEVPETEGEAPLEGEAGAYGIALDACAIIPNPAGLNQSVTLSGLEGRCHGAAEDELLKVAVGFRDASGTWAGGEPVVVYSGIPGTAWQSWAATAVLKAPEAAGNYAVWVRNTPSVDTAGAIQDFKNADPLSANGIRDDSWDSALTVEDATVEGESGEGEFPSEGELLVYGITAESCAFQPSPVNPGLPVALNGLGGHYHSGAVGETIKVTVGLRNASGAWTGGNPVVVWSGKPGLAWQAWSGSATLTAPALPGDYVAWVRNTATTSDKEAIEDFKHAVPASADETRNDRFETALQVALSYGVTLTACTYAPNPAAPGQGVVLNGLGGRYHGGAVGETIKLTAGFRDASGAWAGGEPVVIKSGTPGVSWQSWSGNAVLAAPLAAGSYGVWVRNTATTNDADAIQDFKTATPAVSDEERNAMWNTAVLVRAADEGEAPEGEGEYLEGEDAGGEPEEGAPEEGEDEQPPPACCGCVSTCDKESGTPREPGHWLGDLLLLGAALLVLCILQYRYSLLSQRYSNNCNCLGASSSRSLSSCRESTCKMGVFSNIVTLKICRIL
ncbi:MAG: hypothetical protein GXY07_08035 [Candidatus Hydrogenedentes bacterium]|nr:hypothetical protein [Candidatus Hydrogenedentota bacterium]